MKRFNCQRVVGALIGVMAILGLAETAEAQTVLAPGDVAVVGFNMDDEAGSPDSITLVTFVDLAVGTRISFSDAGFSSSTSTYRITEGAIELVLTAALSAGSVFSITTPGTGDFPSLAAGGDQIFVFQGMLGIGTGGSGLLTGMLLFGVNDDGAGVWQADSTSPNTSALPPGLTGHEVALPELDNYAYIGITTGTRAALYAAIRTAANWMGNDALPFPTRPTMFTITTGATDGGVPDTDAGAPAVDAGPPDVDAGPPAIDAGSPDIDAGTPDIDAGTPDVDAGTADEDMGVTVGDMGTTPGVDAGPRDLGTPSADLGARDLGTTMPPSTRDDGGCSCSTPGTAGSRGAAWALLALAALIPLARRRRR